MDGLSPTACPSALSTWPRRQRERADRLEKDTADVIIPGVGATTLFVALSHTYEQYVTRPSALLILRVDTGAVVQRQTLPASAEPVIVPNTKPADLNPTKYLFHEFWGAGPSPSGGLIVIDLTSADGLPEHYLLREVRHLDPTTGSSVTVMTVAADMEIRGFMPRSP